MGLGRRQGGTVVLVTAQASKCILWLLMGYLGFIFAAPYVAALELGLVFLILNRWKLSWIVLMVTCISELAACGLLFTLSLTQLLSNPASGLLVEGTMSFAVIFIVVLFELLAGLTKEVRVHYLGGQPPPFKPAYTGGPPEPEF
jgi:hypothetical protein